MSFDLLKAFGVDLNDKNEENYFPKILIQFLMNRKLEDIKLLKEIEINNDNNSLIEKDIICFEKCIKFMNKIGGPKETINMTDYDLVHKAISLTQNYFELEEYLKNFIEHFKQIKELINKNEIKSINNNK